MSLSAQPRLRRPHLVPTDLTGHQSPNASSSHPPQQVSLPDLYHQIGDRLVRYRVKIDSSYISQSDAVADVWSRHGVGWLELARINVGREFYFEMGPAKNATDPESRELSKFLRYDNAYTASQSWQKVVDRLADEAATVLELINGSN